MGTIGTESWRLYRRGFELGLTLSNNGLSGGRISQIKCSTNIGRCAQGRRNLNRQNCALTHITCSCSNYLTYVWATSPRYYLMDLDQIFLWCLLAGCPCYLYLIYVMPLIPSLTCLLTFFFSFFVFAFNASNIGHFFNLNLFKDGTVGVIKARNSLVSMYSIKTYKETISSWMPTKYATNTPSIFWLISCLKLSNRICIPHIWLIIYLFTQGYSPSLIFVTLLLREPRYFNISVKNSFETKTYPPERGRGTDRLEKERVEAYGALESVALATSVEVGYSYYVVSFGVSLRSIKPRVSMSMCMLDWKTASNNIAPTLAVEIGLL